ncbi:hypothetical protein ACETIH_21130 [Microvirga arabica]|uniref:Uncharacterized protein n=1 Tax=Microvirga arabica TaxID=1128671 RepID=A0ABV6YD32_9HYPH
MRELIKDTGVVAFSVKEIGNNAGSLKRLGLLGGAERATDSREPAPVGFDELVSRITKAKDEQVH